MKLQNLLYNLYGYVEHSQINGGVVLLKPFGQQY